MSKDIYKGCDIEVYFDEAIGCNVTLIKSMEGRFSPTRLSSHKEAQAFGFEDVFHFEGYLYFNRLDNEQYTGFDVDVMHIHSSGETQN